MCVCVPVLYETAVLSNRHETVTYDSSHVQLCSKLIRFRCSLLSHPPVKPDAERFPLKVSVVNENTDRLQNLQHRRFHAPSNRSS